MTSLQESIREKLIWIISLSIRRKTSIGGLFGCSSLFHCDREHPSALTAEKCQSLLSRINISLHPSSRLSLVHKQLFDRIQYEGWARGSRCSRPIWSRWGCRHRLNRSPRLPTSCEVFIGSPFIYRQVKCQNEVYRVVFGSKASCPNLGRTNAARCNSGV